jgi:hypothetical protein
VPPSVDAPGARDIGIDHGNRLRSSLHELDVTGAAGYSVTSVVQCLAMPRKSEPFSMRLSQVTDDLVSQEARRTRRSKGAVVESLAEEALRARRFPGVAFRGTDWNRRPWVIGTALDVWEIAAAARGFESARAMAGATDLTEAQVRLALAYHREFPHEIDAAIAENERELEDLQREYPTVDTVTIE